MFFLIFYAANFIISTKGVSLLIPAKALADRSNSGQAGCVLYCMMVSHKKRLVFGPSFIFERKTDNDEPKWLSSFRYHGCMVMNAETRIRNP